MKAYKPVSSSHETVPAGLGARTPRADLRCGGDCGPIVVIDRCDPARNYLVKCLEEATEGAKVIAFPSASEWLEVAQDQERPKVVLVCNSSRDDPEGSIVEYPSLLSGLTDVCVIVLPNTDVAASLAAQPHWRSRIAARDRPELASCSGEQKEAFASRYWTAVVE